ncbi:hypothetical protein [Pedobacter nutrimenti]|uniref:DUF4175 family protein n=1 Tax=Pedobacter nutrimenti TaxID=1241337 RepID=A0A318UP76_9SPHI|nr:hypothetical protein [Pedobacter nutrimenti]PYF77340.1 hypothetical protein B0O44_101821 [Pedobacter nutrimenti]
MRGSSGKIWMENIRQKWMLFVFLKVLMISAGAAMVITVVFMDVLHGVLWLALPVFLIAFAVLAYCMPFWKVSTQSLSGFLDRSYPELEESSSLLCQSTESLSVLEKFQQQKIEGKLPHSVVPFKRLWKTMLFPLLGLLFCLFWGWLKPLQGKDSSQGPGRMALPAKIKERIPKGIASFQIRIHPPSYTGKAQRTQQQFALRVESEALVEWEMESNTPARSIRLLFNDQQVLELRKAGKTGIWKAKRSLMKPGFYQVEVDGQKSDLYQIELIPDLPVQIKINHPGQHSVIDYGQPPVVDLRVSLSDDYGIRTAFIAATLASGKGEGVSFTEKKLLFKTSFKDQRQLNLEKSIDLKALGMKPGDELYFFVKALDNHGQNSSSDVYYVSMVDTTELMSLSGMTSSVSLVPEYFRSQRQIIIDTEKLLKEKGSLSDQAFKDRSNALGMDQKLLRLRYGKFLGEESENDIGDHEHEEGEEHHHQEKAGSEEAKFGDVKEIMERYSHQHDNAEDASFFEPQLKAQLKNVLTEMWNSELRLRTYKTVEALPYEYKALRLLKDLQQKSRAYVAKTTVKIAQLKEDKRLSGELDKIAQPVQKSVFKPNEEKELLLKKALLLLENRRARVNLTTSDQLVLQQLEREMILAAADHPATFLSALQKLKQISSGKMLPDASFSEVERAVQKIMPVQPAKPKEQQKAPASALYERYFNHLKEMER